MRQQGAAAAVGRQKTVYKMTVPSHRLLWTAGCHHLEVHTTHCCPLCLCSHASHTSGSPTRTLNLNSGHCRAGRTSTAPLLLLPTADFPAACCWMAPEVTGQPPAPRAFHSCTQISPGVLLVFGGLGPGCCRADAAVLTLGPTCRWEKLRISGIAH